MGTELRRLGVYGENLPVKKSRTVSASDFLIGGILGQFERKYLKAFRTTNPAEFQEIFGIPVNSAWYGGDAVKGFWDNVAGATAKLYGLSYVGNTGSAVDAVVASASINDRNGSPAPTIKAQAAYKEELEYGISGNRTGYKITNGYRFSTLCAGSQDTANTFLLLDSVSGIKVGDLIKIEHTSPIYKKVTVVNESLGRVDFVDALGATVADNVIVGVIGLRIQTYRKSLTGVENEVETDLGRIWVTLEPEVTEFYIQNIHSQNRWVKWSDLGSASALQNSWPNDVSTVAYMASGADGTAASTAGLSYMLTYFASLPIRFLACPETSVVAFNKALETYAKSREDNPIIIYTLPENQSKAQLVALGNGYQRSDDVLAVAVANWLGVTDPFSTSSSKDRNVPPVGHVMGAWIRSIATLGIHWIPANRKNPLLGCNTIIGDQLLSDTDRTDIANAGVNMIQELTGYGISIRNFFTPSTETAYRFANGILMRNYIKISAVDSLQESENTPNSMSRIKEDGNALFLFGLNLWNVGSTGSAPTGETFGVSENDDGSQTAFEDHYEVKSDAINNPQDQINLGYRNIDVYFTYPAPAGSIKIGVGILLRS